MFTSEHDTNTVFDISRTPSVVPVHGDNSKRTDGMQRIVEASNIDWCLRCGISMTNSPSEIKENTAGQERRQDAPAPCCACEV